MIKDKISCNWFHGKHDQRHLSENNAVIVNSESFLNSTTSISLGKECFVRDAIHGVLLFHNVCVKAYMTCASVSQQSCPIYLYNIGYGILYYKDYTVQFVDVQSDEQVAHNTSPTIIPCKWNIKAGQIIFPKCHSIIISCLATK